MDEHRLVIDNLRDLKAHCACGRWEMTGITLDRETDTEIRQRAQDQWQMHQR